MATNLFFILGLLIATARVELIKAQANIDTRVPIVRISPDSGNKDAFGFALALHRIEQVNDTDDLMTAVSKARVIVGAPKGTFPGGLNLPDPGNDRIDRTGLIYKCSIAPGSMDCDAIQRPPDTINDIQSLQGTGRLFDHTSNANLRTMENLVSIAEFKEGQLLGATIYSNGDTVVMCAPLWTSTGVYDSKFMSNSLNKINKVNRLSKGRCYWTNTDLSQVNFLDPCNSPVVNNNPLTDGNETFCTAGTGVTAFSTATNPRVFAVGAPGFDRGTGALFWGSTQQQLEDRSKNGAFGRGNAMQLNSSDLLDNIIEVGQGFQVTSGYITQSKKAVTYVPNVLTSVPRYDNTNYTGLINIYNVGDIQNFINVKAEGQQFGEYFGYALAAVDLNGDGYDEVVVGAPMYSNMDDIKVEIGRTYIFRNTEGDLSSEPMIFEGNVPKGRFGMSAVNLGDIDQDKYEDVAIGAPYEVNGDSTGVVYIYYGSSNFTTFQQQTPFKIRAQDIKNELSSVPQLSKLETFGFSLSSGVDVDNNGYNDLAIGAFESKAIFIFRTLPVADVTVQLMPLQREVLRANKNCNVNGVSYACFTMKVILQYSSGVGLSGPLNVTISLSEVQSNNEQRVFFGQNPSTTTQSLLLRPSPTTEENIRIYILDNIVDSKSNITIMATVQQNPLRTFSSSTGQPPIVDLDPDFRIRIPAPASTKVELRNNCGNDNICETDSSLVVQTPPTYLPSGRGYTSIEVGGVKQVRFRITLTNTGTIESAISLMLTVEHSRPGVFSDQLTVVYVASSDTETCASPCNVRELDPSEAMVIEVTLSVLSQVTVGDIQTTFNLTSTQTVDNNINNNMQTVSMKVERRAELSVSLLFPSEVTYTDMQPTVQDRSDVGPRITLEVIASNVGSTTINNARLDIYYPAQFSATGSDLFFLLPERSVTTSVMPPSGSTTITCDNTALERASTLPSSSGKRKKRHTVSPAFRRQRREARAAKDSASLFDTAHRRLTRQETAAQTSGNNLNCSSNRGECLLVTCNITGLQGQERTSARVTVGGYVDQRFFTDKSDTYTLTVSAVLSFDSMSENTINDRSGPASNRTQLKLVSEPSGSSGENEAVLIAVVIVILLVGITAIIVVGIILYCCGFLRRKKKAEKEEGEVAGVTVTEEGAASQKETAPTGTRDESTTL